MLRLESKILQREFVVHENTLYASQILTEANFLQKD